jgi:hypothetical protein
LPWSTRPPLHQKDRGGLQEKPLQSCPYVLLTGPRCSVSGSTD